ncbi:hypothetical protein M446_4002 [Methylobacterium sp. 4-46]|uniref:hypothetical protein n=1 Tax=unclassified Methylobacterium TaxID=2615210 RepID=UPI000152C9F0|nr:MULTISPECIES: hypothetical protein [Methylobacterium]ACA18366.1 hypothetical protein M446_4002 [Methylobacterium sp. 4-46]WFT77660.1 hypothetical protein QA634_20325 [Methylobacterium nodulans]
MHTLDVAVLTALVVLGVSLAYAWRRERRHRQRNLASALVGEIVAVLRAIETHDVLARLEHVAATVPRVAVPTLPPIPAAVYQAYAGCLDRLEAPLPRKISYFYTRLQMLQGDLAALSLRQVQDFPAVSGASFAAELARDLRDTLAVGDEILKDLRPLLVRRRLHIRLRRTVASTAKVYRKLPRATLRHPFAHRPPGAPLWPWRRGAAPASPAQPL